MHIIGGDPFVAFIRRYYLLRSTADRCVTIWSRRFAVTALDGPHANCRPGDPFPLRSIHFLAGVDTYPSWPEREWQAQVVVVDPQLRLVVVELTGGERFELDPRVNYLTKDKYFLEKEEQFPANHYPLWAHEPNHDFGAPISTGEYEEDEAWMDFALFGLASKFGRGEIFSEPVIKTFLLIFINYK
jgi:hypothetical protein